MDYTTGTTDQIEDDWTNPLNTTKDVKTRWRGTTVFKESAHHPQVLLDDLTSESRQPRTLPTPTPPTVAERELHNLTHMPFRAWCPICVKACGLPTQHRQVYDRKPLIQVDYGFITPKSGGQITVLSAIDVTTGLTMSCVVPSKGPID